MTGDSRTDNESLLTGTEGTFTQGDSVYKDADAPENARDIAPMEKVSLKTLKTRYSRYVIMMYVIGGFSGCMMLTTYITVHYVKNVLGCTAVQLNNFNAFASLSWTIKPIYGYISESIFPFKYRLKSYLVFCCGGILVTSIAIAVLKP